VDEVTAVPDGEPIAESTAVPAAPGPAALPAAPVLELLDRDGQVRQVHRVTAWPLTVGRALDNDLPLSDPHLAAHHLRIVETAAGGLQLEALDAVNGVVIGRRRLRSGETLPLPADGAPPELHIGRTRLRLRLAGQALAPVLPLAAAAPHSRRFGPIVLAALIVLAGMTFNTWLESDPDTLGRAIGAMLMSAAMATAVWCGLWALLSKTFTRQSHFGWHLKVFLFASVAWLLIALLPDLFAFSLSWAWLSDFSFVAGYAVIAAALYFHLLALEVARPRLLRGVAAAMFVTAVGLSAWFNHQRSGRIGAELYMSHLFPPGLRLAGPVPVDRFVERLAPLQATLDKKAKEPPRGDGGDGDFNDE
jgi:hypothetical protein